MNKILVACLSVTIAVANSAPAQGTFQNLDFESATLIFLDPPINTQIAVSNALPGWTAFVDGNPQTVIRFGLTGAFHPLHLYASTNGGSISGNFSVLLTGFDGIGSIEQSGGVPLDAQTLRFKTGSDPLTIALDGQLLSYVAIPETPGLYAADISAFAGQSATLSIAGVGINLLDDIEFSPEPIPEPSSPALLSLAGLLFAVRRLKRLPNSV